MKASGISAIVLWTDKFKEMIEFYRAVGVPLETEEHEEGPVHYACELGTTHFAVYEGKAGSVVGRGAGGCTMIGLQVSDVDEAFKAAKKLGATTIWDPHDKPWGRAAQVTDPDGRPVELNPSHG